MPEQRPSINYDSYSILKQNNTIGNGYYTTNEEQIIAAFDRWKANTTGIETIAQKGKNHVARFFCDHASSGVYTTKGPVAKLDMDPLVQFINTNIAWSVSNSRSATGTLDSFDLTFGGGGAANLTGQDWAVDPLTGNVQYTSTGQFTATLVVTDTLGNASQPATLTIDIVDIANGIAKIYIATSDTGIFTYLPGGTPATANTGLSGGDLNENSGKLNPHFAHLPAGQHHYAAANDNGFIISFDGAATYLKVTKATLGNPTNTAGDVSPPTTTDLDEIAIAFDPKDVRRIYILRLTDSTWNASFDPRAFLYWTNDYGTTWFSFGIGV